VRLTRLDFARPLEASGTPPRPSQGVVRPDGAYVVTGGLGGIGLVSTLAALILASLLTNGLMIGLARRAGYTVRASGATILRLSALWMIPRSRNLLWRNRMGSS
jgi:hypothetical protein